MSPQRSEWRKENRDKRNMAAGLRNHKMQKIHNPLLKIYNDKSPASLSLRKPYHVKYPFLV